MLANIGNSEQSPTIPAIFFADVCQVTVDDASFRVWFAFGDWIRHEPVTRPKKPHYRPGWAPTGTPPC